MPYATLTDLTERFGERQLLEIADREGNGVVDSDVVDRALTDADAEINTYVGRRYPLPLAPVPERIASLAADIAFFRLHPSAVPEDVRRRYEDALAALRDIADGKAVLDAEGAQPASGTGGPAAVTQERVFSRTTLDGF